MSTEFVHDHRPVSYSFEYKLICSVLLPLIGSTRNEIASHSVRQEKGMTADFQGDGLCAASEIPHAVCADAEPLIAF